MTGLHLATAPSGRLTEYAVHWEALPRVVCAQQLCSAGQGDLPASRVIRTCLLCICIGHPYRIIVGCLRHSRRSKSDGVNRDTYSNAAILKHYSVSSRVNRTQRTSAGPLGGQRLADYTSRFSCSSLFSIASASFGNNDCNKASRRRGSKLSSSWSALGQGSSPGPQIATIGIPAFTFLSSCTSAPQDMPGMAESRTTP